VNSTRKPGNEKVPSLERAPYGPARRLGLIKAKRGTNKGEDASCLGGKNPNLAFPELSTNTPGGARETPDRGTSHEMDGGGTIISGLWKGRGLVSGGKRRKKSAKNSPHQRGSELAEQIEWFRSGLLTVKYGKSQKSL